MTEHAYRPVCPADSLAEGQVAPHYLDDLHLRVAIARVGGTVYAFRDMVSGAPLSSGLLRGTRLMSHVDGTWYELSTGAPVDGPDNPALETYPARESRGLIEIAVPG
ncbi:Rieske (2Fe-2S) protein [Dyella telluris]|uniref:Rieske domain-containing protein n=1 Tax=Dyella telluris TaxID=2763498 RepID=A0A7G8PZC5_9GAMM|nr:hypothetical protein [Dyella telluris]QNJ99882.1 hypothetical protein H8F01_12105 [Dyella telluris]